MKKRFLELKYASDVLQSIMEGTERHQNSFILCATAVTLRMALYFCILSSGCWRPALMLRTGGSAGSALAWTFSVYSYNVVIERFLN